MFSIKHCNSNSQSMKITKQLSEQQIDECRQKAISYFEHGFNCSQSVVAACAEYYNVPEEWALRMSASFGGGIGRMRMTCGAACGMFLLAGLQCGNTLPDEPQKKLPNYTLVQELAQSFKGEHGSLVCAELLGLGGQPKKQKMPCKQMVGEAVALYLRTINKRLSQSGDDGIL